MPATKSCLTSTTERNRRCERSCDDWSRSEPLAACVLGARGLRRQRRRRAAVAASGIPSEFAAPTAAPDDARTGGDLTVLAAGDIDYMDPAPPTTSSPT